MTSTSTSSANAATRPAALPDNPVVSGPLRRTLIGLALPVAAEQILSTLVGLVDTFLAGRLPAVSVAATSAVGFSAYAGWLVSMLFMLVGTGTTVLVARAFGANDRAQANRVLNQSMVLALVMGVLGAVAMYTLAPHFASWLNMEGMTASITVRYLRLDSLSYAVWAWTLVGGAALRGAGDMRTPLKVLAVVNAINAAVSPLLSRGIGPLPALGIDGIVAGAICARTLGGLCIVYVLLRGRLGLRLGLSACRPCYALMWRILRIGLPAAADGAIMWTGHFLFLKLIAWTGSSAGGPINYAFAAHMVVVRLEAFTYLPANAWAAACATMLGQALGAGLPQRARLVGREAALQAGCVAAVIGLGFIVFARPLCALMHEDPHVVDQAAGVLRMIGAFEPVLALTIVYMGALRGAGDTVFPLFFTAFGLALVRLPVSYLLALYLGWGLRGAWLGVSADLLVRMTLAWTRFRRGRWVATKV